MYLVSPASEIPKAQGSGSNRSRISKYCLGEASSPLMRHWGSPRKAFFRLLPSERGAGPKSRGPHRVPVLRKRHTQGPGVKSVVGHCSWAPSQWSGGYMEELNCFWGKECSLPTPLPIPLCTLQSRLGARLTSITSTPHVSAMGGNHSASPHCTEEESEAQRGEVKWLQSQSWSAENLESQPSRAPARPARDSLR